MTQKTVVVFGRQTLLGMLHLFVHRSDGRVRVVTTHATVGRRISSQRSVLFAARHLWRIVLDNRQKDEYAEDTREYRNEDQILPVHWVGMLLLGRVALKSESNKGHIWCQVMDFSGSRTFNVARCPALPFKRTRCHFSAPSFPAEARAPGGECCPQPIAARGQE